MIRKVRLIYKETVFGTDPETGADVSRVLPRGSVVSADVDFKKMPHPSSHGGGWDADITDLDTGWTGRGRVE